MIPEPDDDEAVVFEEFFVAGLCMPPHPTLNDILLKFQAQLHQLTPNAIAQLIDGHKIHIFIVNIPTFHARYRRWMPITNEFHEFC
jgi:hypothetical protein